MKNKEFDHDKYDLEKMVNVNKIFTPEEIKIIRKKLEEETYLEEGSGSIFDLKINKFIKKVEIKFEKKINCTKQALISGNHALMAKATLPYFTIKRMELSFFSRITVLNNKINVGIVFSYLILLHNDKSVNEILELFETKLLPHYERVEIIKNWIIDE
jgi:hypothetical protein